MLSRTRSAAVSGVEASLVEVEVHVSPGGNGEARIVAAIRNSGHQVPYHRITINLAPADLRKEGSSFDLPVAVGVLASAGIIGRDTADTLMIGELALDGRLRPVRGALPVAMLARDAGIRNLIVPVENSREAALVDGVSVYPLTTLNDVISHLNASDPPPALEAGIEAFLERECAVGKSVGDDFSDIQGQAQARRAVEVAIAGGHNILLIGSPGSGKTMIARRVASIMPPMTPDECLETTRVHSVAGTLPAGAGVIGRRPFRAPHHTVSDAGLVGGGSIPRPGEVSLAHNGVLFLDELPEFRRSALEVLRQPLEEGRVSIARAHTTLSFPANFILIGAMNPCPCAYLGDESRECTCTPGQVQRYLSRLSGPLLDRIDIHVHVPRVAYGEIAHADPAESSAAIRERVVAARAVQQKRFGASATRANAGMITRQIRDHCGLDHDCDRVMERAIGQLSISVRGYTRILKVARTIADLEASPEIGTRHLSEAVRYRVTEARA